MKPIKSRLTVFSEIGFSNKSNDNTFIGYQSGFDNISGTSNTFVGSAAGFGNIADNNTFIGSTAGLTITSGTNNVIIGQGADAVATRTGAIIIGKDATANANNTWIIGTVGKKQAIVEGANAAMGTATLTSSTTGLGVVVVNNTIATGNSRIFLTTQVTSGTIGSVYISTRTSGTSFTIASTASGDRSLVAWEVKEPN